MKIAMLSANPADSNGWGRYTHELVTALSAYDVQIVMITSIDADEKTDLPVAAWHRTLPSLTPAPRFTSLRLLNQIAVVRHLCTGCEVIHVTAEPYTIAVPTSFPLIVTAHGTYLAQTAKRPLFGGLYTRDYRRAAVLCVSKYTEHRVKAAIPKALTVVIPNGVDATRFQEPVSLPDGEKHGPTILAVGQIKQRKGFHLLAEAMRDVRAVIPTAEAIFIGDMSDTAYCDTIRAQLAADGLTDAVRWLGRVPEDTLLSWYHAADVFALPALNIGDRFEGFGLVYLEASAAGLPVIGTLDCGAEDAIRDGETGYLVPQNDPATLAQGLIRLLSDPELRATMGAAGRAYAAEYTWDRAAQRVYSIYKHEMPT